CCIVVRASNRNTKQEGRKMADYAGKIAECVVNNRDWIKATRKDLIADWLKFGADPTTARSNASADLYRKIEERIGVPESYRVGYDFLQDNFNLNIFRGKLETIAAKIEDWYPTKRKLIALGMGSCLG